MTVEHDCKVVPGDARDATGDDELQRQFPIQCDRPIDSYSDFGAHHGHQCVRRDQEAMACKVDGSPAFEGAVVQVWQDGLISKRELEGIADLVSPIGKAQIGSFYYVSPINEL